MGRDSDQFCGNTGHAADVEGVPGVHIEGKHQEQLRLYEWIEQAERDAAGSGKIPAVHRRKNRRESLVTLRLNDFIELIKKGADLIFFTLSLTARGVV